MKITFDTKTKQTLCPPEFFETVRKINDANELTGASKEVSSKDYLKKIIDECSKTIVNQKDLSKPRRHGSRNSVPSAKIANLVVEAPSEK